MSNQLELFPNFPRVTLQIVIPEIPLEEPDTYDYPPSDLPMAENTLHFNLLNYIKNALEALLKLREDALVAGDLMLYYKKDKKIYSLAPDVMLAYDRDKSHRRSYIIHKENDIPPKLTFEITSRFNYKNKPDLFKRWNFYQEIGVEEYFVIHTEPKLCWIELFVRVNGLLVPSLDFGKYKSYQAGVSLFVEEGVLKLEDRSVKLTQIYTFVVYFLLHSVPSPFSLGLLTLHRH